MKTKKNLSILHPCLGLLIAMAVALSCNNDDGATQSELEEVLNAGITLAYPDSLVQTTFRKPGSMAPNTFDWKGEKGTLSISSSTEILQRDDIKFEESTGIIFWSRRLPLGEFDLTVTAKNSNDSVSAKIVLAHKFDKGFFGGGFLAGDLAEIDPTTIPTEYGLTLNEDQTVSLLDYTDPTFSASGTWEALGGDTIAIEFSSNGQTTYMKGNLFNDIQPKIDGTYGGERDASGEISNATGRFLFKWD